MRNVTIRGEDRGDEHILCYVDGDKQMVKVTESSIHRVAFVSTDSLKSTLLELREDGWNQIRIREA